MVNKFFSGLIKRKVAVPALFTVLVIVCAAMLPLVTVNYDMANYLPADAGTSRAIKVAQAEFGYPGTAQAMAKGVTVTEAVALKEKIKAVPGIKSVLWLDDVTDVSKPLDFINKDTLESYYKDNDALYQIEFTDTDYSQTTSQALLQVRSLDSRLIIAGNAESSRSMKETLAGEMGGVIAIVVPVCILILVLASMSWLEPVVYLVVMGVSVAINMGTNALFGSVSFITNSMASVLLMAVSMDYSIFLMHRYFEERDQGAAVETAVVNAAVASLSAVAASALTTVAGFAALLFMRYGIGADIGLVLLKGIVISFVTVMLLMPVLIRLLHKPLDRLRHRSLIPNFGPVGKAISKVRFGIIAVALLLAIPALLAQSKNQFLYGDSSASAGAGKALQERNEIIGKFGVNNAIMLLVPVGDTAGEIALADDLEAQPQVLRVTALVTIADSAIARGFLPQSVVDSFTSAHYSRMIAYIRPDGETPETFEAVKQVREAAERHYPGQWLAAGHATSLADIKDTVSVDSNVVTLVSLLAVGLIVLLTFRSVTLPLLLLLTIQSAVWINMSVPYFSGFSMAYLGYLVISSLQLGSTIDYGILLTSRFREFRSLKPPKEAAIEAVKAAAPPIITSALILATAGISFGLISKVDSISQLGALLGRGALISGTMSVLLLPALLIAADWLIEKTTLKSKNGVTIG